MGFLKISDIFARFGKTKTVAMLEAGEDPVRLFTGGPGGIENIPEDMRHMVPLIAGHIIGEEALPGVTGAVNLGTLYWIWSNAPLHQRKIFRLRQEISAHLARVNLGFLPPKPPACWINGSIVLESISSDKPLVAHYACIAAYFTQDSKGVWRYFFIGLKYPDGFHFWGVKADFGHLNNKLAASGQFMDLPVLPEADGGDVSPAEQLALIKFVFASSYYIEQNRFDSVVRSGPPVRDKKGKAVKHGGKPVALWSYVDLSGGPESDFRDVSMPRGPLDTSRLDLTPTIVSPHIRMRDGKVIIVDAYDSHRWRRPLTGQKTKI